MRVDAVASKCRHSNDIIWCQKYILSQINTGASIHFISSQNTVHSINWSVIYHYAVNFMLIHKLPFWPVEWSDVSGANKHRTADRHVQSSIIWLDRPIFGHQLDGRFDGRLAANWWWKNGHWDDFRLSPKVDRRSIWSAVKCALKNGTLMIDNKQPVSLSLFLCISSH